MYKPEAQARAELTEFVFHFDPRCDSMPKGIDPALVERFLREVSAPKKPPLGPAERMSELADFYDTRGVVPDWIKLLDRSEKTEDSFVASVFLTRAIGQIGDDEQRRFGRSYYHHLLSLPYLDNRTPELLDCFAAYTPEETKGMTVTRLDEVVNELRAKAQADPGAGMTLRALENLRNVTLPRIEGAAAMKAEILALPSAAARLERYVDIYLAFDERYAEYTGRWAIRMILRDARTSGPEGAIAAFREALPRLEGRPAEEAWRARDVHAIELLGGELTADEKAAVRPDNKRYDLLSNE